MVHVLEKDKMHGGYMGHVITWVVKQHCKMYGPIFLCYQNPNFFLFHLFIC